MPFESEGEALRYIAQARKVASGRSLGGAVTEYLEHRKAHPGKGGRPLRDSTLSLERWRIVGMLHLDQPDADRPLASLTRAAMRRVFDVRATEVKPDTMAGELAAVRRACAWWVAMGWMASDPTVGLEVMGERSAGKLQLRVDEARAFLRVALDEGTPAGDACALALLSGMRASEISGLVCHDLDDQGRLLWVADNSRRRLKTLRSKRRLRVPAVLVPRLLALAGMRDAEAPLWGDVDRHWLGYHVRRLCEKARVPVVCPHGLRGTWATLAAEAVPTERVAAALGNTPAVAGGSYIEPGAVQRARTAEVESLLGTSGSPQFPRPDGGPEELPN